MDVLRYDAFEWPGKTERTPEGFLRVDAPLTRFGVLQYRGPDGKMRGELRHPDDWGQQAVLDAFRSLPVTNDHPPPRSGDGLPLVDARNAKRVAVGWTGDQVRRDGNLIRSRLTIVDEDAVRAVESGRRGTSTGVLVALVPETGTFDGESYEMRQTNPRLNHIALVDSPRAGTTIRLDSSGHQVRESPEGDPPMSDTKKLSIVRLDGIDYEAAPEVANALAKAREEATGLKAKLDAAEKQATDAADKLRAERDSLKERLDAAEKRDIRAEVKKRVALETSARRVLPEGEHEKLDSMDDGAIRKAVVAAKWPELKLDDQSEAYIAARFEIAVEDAAKTDAEDSRRQDAAARQRAAVAPRQDGTNPSADAARAAMDRIANQWRPDWKPGAAA